MPLDFAEQLDATKLGNMVLGPIEEHVNRRVIVHDGVVVEGQVRPCAMMPAPRVPRRVPDDHREQLRRIVGARR